MNNSVPSQDETPTSTSPTPDWYGRNKVKIFFGMLAAVVFIWTFSAWNHYPFKITVDLEVNGEAVTLTRTIRCIPKTQSQGIGSKTLTFYVPEIGSFGTKLKDGSGVFIATPRVCELRQGGFVSTFKPIHPDYLPFIGWTATPDNPESFEVYLTREAITAPDRRVHYKGVRVSSAPFWRKLFPSSLDDFSELRIPSVQETNNGPPRKYRGFFAVCLDTARIADWPQIKLFAEATNIPAVLPAELRAEAGEISEYFQNSENEFLHPKYIYLRDEKTSESSRPSQILDRAISGFGLAPYPPPDGKKSEYAYLDRQRSESILPLRRTETGRELDLAASGVIEMGFVPQERWSDPTYDLTSIKFSSGDVLPRRQIESVAVPNPPRFCLIDIASMHIAPRAKR
jgi:hypothetical protein